MFQNGNVFFYYAYGLRIKSDITLPMPPATETNYDVEVKLNNGYSNLKINEEYYLKISNDFAALYSRNVALFEVSNGILISITPASGVECDLIRQFIIGMMMGIILYQRGMLVLHASVVKVGSGAAAFLGNIEAGKSSITAALMARGHLLVTDDVAAVRIENDKAYVCPGLPLIKVDQPIISKYDLKEENLVGLHSRESKLGFLASDQFLRTPCPLKHIFVLARGERKIQLLQPKDAFWKILANSIPTRWVVKADPKRDIKNDSVHFTKCADLIKLVSVNMFQREFQLGELSDQAKYVETFIAS